MGSRVANGLFCANQSTLLVGFNSLHTAVVLLELMATRAQINFCPLVIGRGSQIENSLAYLGGSETGTIDSDSGGKIVACIVHTEFVNLEC